MQNRRRLVLSVVAAAIVTGVVPPSWARAPSPTTTVAAQPLVPLAAGTDSDSIVNSWALAPKFNDIKQGGSRPNLAYEIAPGAEVHDEVTLFNLSNVPLTFHVYATDAFNTSDGGFDLLPGDKTPSDVGTWVTMPQDSITLQAKTQATMPISIKVPVTARPGDHAGAILASSPAQSEGADGRTVTVDRRTGSRMYVRVAGPLAPRLAVQNLHSSYRPGLSPVGGTADVTYRVVNVGNVRMTGKQRVSVSGPLGLASHSKATVDVPELLPGQGYTVHATFHGAPAAALSVAKVRLDPALVGSTAKQKSAHWQSLAPAPPYSVLVLVLSIWLLLRARRAYVRRRDAGEEPFAR